MYDAIIISDLHLGSSVSQTKTIKKFLENLPRTHELILNGDILENSHIHLRKEDWEIITLLSEISNKTDTIFIKGNHDNDAFHIADLIGAEFVKEYDFESGGKPVHVEHGDKFDDFIVKHPILTWIGDFIYGILQRINHKFAVFSKNNSKIFIHCGNKMECAAIDLAKKKNFGMIVLGHLHQTINKFTCRYQHPYLDIQYLNSGSWVEPLCSYVTIKDGIGELHWLSI